MTTTNPHCRVDPALPLVLDAEVFCPHCQQSLETIADGLGNIPERHYVRPTTTDHGNGPRIVIRTTSAASHISARLTEALCPYTDDALSTVILRAQHAAANAATAARGAA